MYALLKNWTNQQNSDKSNQSKGLERLGLLFISRVKSSFPINRARLTKNYIFSFIAGHLIYYPTPVCLTYAWSFGSLAGIALIIQIISGVFLSTHYSPNIDLAFSIIEYIMRDAPNGWFIRYIHANGASMFFIVVYAHICRDYTMVLT